MVKINVWSFLLIILEYWNYDTTYPYHSYNFRVAVRDQDGRPSPNVTALVVVYVTNENDFAPEFIHQTVSTIPDNLASGSTVMNVRAIDKDGDKVSYSFQGNIVVVRTVNCEYKSND